MYAYSEIIVHEIL